ncbi:class I SAM-dependent methyltransferase [Cyanobium gracile]|uniref:SAM-dependent methyltransferase n=1 Tax=Cyanobium gracile (strain ATCC 27147 / PCC 6307) TaxID=292564 RepID=K9P779_CYAGP|nr:class I SAM-dependent methyltransferase [Cyanobium gracile]AFY28586.1 SAM-dependent methyltransferase [Cyanobium gracile PCC 6307]
MDPNPAYPTEKTYGAFLHRELSVSWLMLATLMGGRHRLDPDLLNRQFSYLDLGCGHGLNLLFNAAAHPRARFYGLDLNPTHIAGARAKAEALGLGNVQFALADLTTFSEGRPSTGPCRGWPEAYDVVVAHGLASWVGPAVREALIAAAGSLLRPGGIFYCSYNTYPGWLSRSTLQMLSVEEALRAGGSTSAAGIRKAADTLLRCMGSEDNVWPLGHELPGLRSQIEQFQPLPEAYLVGEYQAAHQPLYVGPMHRLCRAHGLTPIGSASLPELFPELLDPGRRALVMEAVDAPMREVLFDLAINQTFRRDLFARGACPPSTPWWRRTLADLQLHSCAESGDDRDAFDTSLGRLGLDPDFVRTLKEVLADGPQSLGWLMEQASLDLEDALMRLAVLAGAGVIGVGFPTATPSPGPAIAGFNQRCLDQITAGEEIGALLSPVLLQPVNVNLLEAFFLQVADAGLPAADLAQLVWMGIGMAGGNVKDPEGQPIEDPEQALSHLQDFWETFAAGRLPVLRRLGIGNAGAPIPAA